MSPSPASHDYHPTSSISQLPSLCLLATNVYITPLMLLLIIEIPVPELTKRKCPVPLKSTENSADVPGYVQLSPGSTIKSTVQVPSETGSSSVVAESELDGSLVPAELMAETR